VEAIAELLGLDVRAFTDRFTYLLQDRSGLSLVERDDGSCVFLEPDGCRIEAAKPLQCRDFPLRWNEPGWETRCASARQNSGNGQTKESGATENNNKKWWGRIDPDDQTLRRDPPDQSYPRRER
jgi:Fe-S-cluster containining protein